MDVVKVSDADISSARRFFKFEEDRCETRVPKKIPASDSTPQSLASI